MRTLVTSLVLALATGCVFPREPVTVALKTKFDPSSVAWAERGGPNRIEGSAFLRTQGGAVVTCAALPVSIVPVTVHAKERMMHLYGNVQRGFNGADLHGTHPIFLNDSPEFYDHVGVTKCDAAGQFSFNGLADGEYFVTATVTWSVHYANDQGGDIMERVRVQGGEARDLLLTL